MNRSCKMAGDEVGFGMIGSKGQEGDFTMMNHMILAVLSICSPNTKHTNHHFYTNTLTRCDQLISWICLLGKFNKDTNLSKYDFIMSMGLAESHSPLENGVSRHPRIVSLIDTYRW